MLVVGPRLVAGKKTRQHQLRNSRGEERLVLAHRLDGREQQPPRVRLEHVPSRPRPQHLPDHLFRLEDREDEHLGPRRGLDDLARGLEPVQLGHADVQHDHVGLQRDGLLHRLSAVGRLAHHFQAALSLEQRAQPFAHHLMIVGDDDAHGHRSLRSRARTRVPRGPDSISSVPPSCESRSRMPAIPTPTAAGIWVLTQASLSRGTPMPRSSTSSTTSGPLRQSRMLALELPECRWTLVKLSCTTRKRVITSSRLSASASAAWGASCIRSMRCRFMESAATVCAADSCSARAMRLRSSSCRCSKRPDKLRTASSACLRASMSWTMPMSKPVFPRRVTVLRPQTVVPSDRKYRFSRSKLLVSPLCNSR